ncbi:MAG TPA: pyrroloquinoline quinone biosynthesis peptide chaperone PqqD [Hyphomicrobiaceae bacterium]|nr:pyrroloquinoline quinone biosynthesis peptide chaperone PqqD [Hyphomicrobiaceae bacterium]
MPPARALISIDSRPELPRYVKLRHDAGRGRWILLAPERVFSPDETGLAILQLCDGKRTVMDIATQLAAEYDAGAEQIAADVIAMLQDLADKGVVKA